MTIDSRMHYRNGSVSAIQPPALKNAHLSNNPQQSPTPIECDLAVIFRLFDEG